MILVLASLRAHAASVFGRDARRLRHVADHPDRATLDDIELLLRAHGVPEHHIWAATDHLAVSDVSAPLAFAFAMEHDGTELANELVHSGGGRLVRHIEGARGVTRL